MNKGTILSYHRDIQTFNPTIAFLLRSKIQEFYKEYGIRIQTIEKFINGLQHEYFVIEENQIKMEDKKPVMKEGKSQDEFNTKLAAYLQEPLINSNQPKLITLT